MLGPGTYTAKVLEHRWTTSQKGDPSLAVKVSIITDFGDEEIYTGYIYFSDAAMGMARAQLRAFGFDPDHEELSDIGDTLSLIDREVIVQLEEHDYRGQISIRIKRFGGSPPPPDKNSIVATQAKLRQAKKRTQETALPTPEPLPRFTDDARKALASAQATTMQESAARVDAAIEGTKEAESDIPF